MEAQSSVRCKTFTLSADALPGVDDLLQAADPARVEQLYREAGLQKLASNVGPLRRGAAAAQNYAELSEEDCQLHAGFLSRVIAVEECISPPPPEALVVLVAAQKAAFFDDIVAMTHPATNESLLLGRVRMGTTTRYFKLAHWGHSLTSIEQLRKRQRLNRAVGRRVRSILSWRPRIRKPQQRGYRGPVFFGVVTALAGVPSWFFLLPINWWLFAGTLAAAMVLCGVYAAKRSPHESKQRYVAGTLIAIHAVAALIVGGSQLNQWNTADRTEEVLACGKDRPWGEAAWYIETSAGERILDAGFYDGIYYTAGNEAAAEALVGNWVKLTVHGRSMGGMSDVFVTEAQILRAGSCG